MGSGQALGLPADPRFPFPVMVLGRCRQEPANAQHDAAVASHEAEDAINGPLRRTFGSFEDELDDRNVTRGVVRAGASEITSGRRSGKTCRAAKGALLTGWNSRPGSGARLAEAGIRAAAQGLGQKQERIQRAAPGPEAPTCLRRRSGATLGRPAYAMRRADFGDRCRIRHSAGLIYSMCFRARLGVQRDEKGAGRLRRGHRQR